MVPRATSQPERRINRVPGIWRTPLHLHGVARYNVYGTPGRCGWASLISVSLSLIPLYLAGFSFPLFVTKRLGSSTQHN